MPATNPRLTITLKPTTAAQMRRLSELTGNSQSALISELLEANEQVFTRLITMLDAAHAVKESLVSDVAAGMQQAQDKVEKQLGLALAEMDAASAPLLAEAERIARRARRRAAGGRPLAGGAGSPEGRSTPMSNRGVRSGQKTPKTPTRTRG